MRVKAASNWIIIIGLIGITSNTTMSQESNTESPGFALYAELVGKGFGSINFDFRLSDKHRICAAVTSLDYEVLGENNPNEVIAYNWPSPGVMYYFLPGSGSHRFELGAGASISPVFNRVYDSEIHDDSPLSLHGVIGYRYQAKNKFFFRAGFTPFYRPKVWFLPLGGLSFGYSW